jgi:hypothetical protein
MRLSGVIKDAETLYELISAIVETEVGIKKILLEEYGIIREIEPFNVYQIKEAVGRVKKVAVANNKVFIMEGVD